MGSVHKLRWRRGSQGKSGDVRCVYYYRDERGMRVHYPRTVDVQAVRVKLGMTQEEFAARFGISTATLRHWERGDRTPRGPALVLLNVIERNPKTVIDALV